MIKEGMICLWGWGVVVGGGQGANNLFHFSVVRIRSYVWAKGQREQPFRALLQLPVGSSGHFERLAATSGLEQPSRAPQRPHPSPPDPTQPPPTPPHPTPKSSKSYNHKTDKNEYLWYCRGRSNITWMSLRFHIDFTSSSLRFHFDFTLISIRLCSDSERPSGSERARAAISRVNAAPSGLEQPFRTLLPLRAGLNDQARWCQN